MASFQAKIGWEMPRKIKNKNCFPFHSCPRGNRKFEKKKEEKSKNQIIPLGLHFKSKQVGKCREIEKIKIVVPFRSRPTCKRKFPKNSENFQKIKKPYYGHFSSQKKLEQAEKERK